MAGFRSLSKLSGRPLPRNSRSSASPCRRRATPRSLPIRALLTGTPKERFTSSFRREPPAGAREALKLPNKKYPKAELIGLIGRLLAVHPALASAAERPVIYRNGKVAA